MSILTLDVLQREDQDFPKNLPKFLKMFPDEAACAAYLE